MLMTTAQGISTSQENAISGFAGKTASKISSDFETFLRMLTTQMQNQNPLEPIEASDFAVQLATFSGVEQQVRTNDILAELSNRMGLSELAGWVGRKVLSAAPHFLNESTLQLVPPEVVGADYAELVFRDLYGVEIARHPTDPSATEILFTPSSFGGSELSAGFYEIEMQSFRAGTLISSAPVLGYAPVEEARIDAGHVLLVLKGGHIIDSSKVVGLRE